MRAFSLRPVDLALPLPEQGLGYARGGDYLRGTDQEAGYQTACIGKWDVSNRKPIIERMPNAQGFDYFFGALGANDAGTVKFHENNRAAGSSNDMGGLTTLYTDKSIDFKEQERSEEALRALPGPYHDAQPTTHPPASGGHPRGGSTGTWWRSSITRPGACLMFWTNSS